MKRSFWFLVIILGLGVTLTQIEPAKTQTFVNSEPQGIQLHLAAGKPNLVRVNGNWDDAGDIPTTGHPTFTTGAEDWREFLMISHASRIRMSGNIEKLIIGWGGSKPDTIIVKFWRHMVGSKYALVGWTQNLSPDIVLSDTTTIVLSPVVPVPQGVNYSLHVANGAGPNNRAIPNVFKDNGATPGPPGGQSMSPGNAGMFFTRPAGSAFPSGNYHWGNQGQGTTTWLHGEYIPIEFYMKAPQVVILGASIISGHNEHFSFWENTFFESTGTEGNVNFIVNDSSTTAMDSMPAFYMMGTGVLDTSTTWPYSLLRPVSDDSLNGGLGYSANWTGWTYQNMGRGSDTAASLLTTITARMTVLHPRLAFIGVGSQDADDGVAVSAHVASVIQVMDTLDAHTVIGVFRGIVPRTRWSSGDTHTERAAQHDTVLAYNRAVRGAVENYIGANNTQMFYVPVYHVLGERDALRVPSGPSGNNYSNLIVRIANTDTIHMNSRGAKLMSEALIKALRRPIDEADPDD